MSDPAPTTPAPAPAAEGYRPTSAHVAGRSAGVQLLGLFSSLKAAAVLIAAMAVVTGVATYYERAYGRDAAAVMIYGSLWFNILWMLLAVNIFGAAAVRWPWRRRQAGFVIVHLGLLLLMAGFFADRNRLDGMLVAPPGEKASRIDLPEDHLVVIDGSGDDGKRFNVRFQPLEHAGLPSFGRYLLAPLLPIPEPGIAIADTVLLSDRSADRWRGALPVPEGFPRVTISRVCLAGEDVLGFATAPMATGDWAARLELSVHTPAMPPGMSQPQGGGWLSERGQTSFELGPVRVALGRVRSEAFLADLLAPAPADAGDGRTLVVYHEGKRLTVDLAQPLPFTVELTDNLAIEVQESYDRPRFDADAHRLNDDPEAALDPLLVARVGTGPAAARDWRGAAVFAFHPAGLEVAPDAGQPELWYDHPASRRGGAGQGVVAQILRTPDGGWALIRTSRTRGRQEGARMAPGQTQWDGMLVGGAGMPMQINLGITAVPDAEPAPMPRAMLPDQRDRASRWIELLVERGSASGRAWFRRDGGDGAGTGQVKLSDGSVVLVRYARALYDLEQEHGFAIRLERFDEGKDIDGSSAATYASDVRVLTKDGGADGEPGRVTMNEPLRHDGVILYQSSFIPEPDEHGDPIPGRYAASVFTVATSPGRVLKYLGSVVLVAGIITLYVMRRTRAR